MCVSALTEQRLFMCVLLEYAAVVTATVYIPRQANVSPLTRGPRLQQRTRPDGVLCWAGGQQPGRGGSVAFPQPWPNRFVLKAGSSTDRLDDVNVGDVCEAAD